MQSLRSRLSKTNNDSGISLIELVVSMMIFALLGAGFVTSMVAVTKMTSDARNRVVAANLASSAVDRARTSTDVMKVVSETSHPLVDGTQFHVALVALWDTNGTGPVGQCSAGGGDLRYKRINVSVTWDGMRGDAPPVRSDSQVAPSTRISDPEKGVIVVSVRKASGEGNPGIKVQALRAAVDPAGAVSVATTPTTDAQGCAYLLNVAPGNYDVSISKASSSPALIDNNQVLAPAAVVEVSKGSSGTAPFQFDQAGVFTPRYASNFAGGTVLLPQSMDTSFVNSYGVYLSSTYGPFRLHPYTAGYSILAGKLATHGSVATDCQSIDPAAWPTVIDASGTLSATRAPVATAPGGSAAVDVRMGVAEITGTSNGYIKATAQSVGPADTGDPGCAVPSSYVYKLPSSGKANLALPFGSWVLTSGNSITQGTSVGIDKITPLALATERVVGGSVVVTVDPRQITVGP